MSNFSRSPALQTLACSPIIGKPVRKPKARKVTGYILYRGPSLLNGAPIVVVAIIAKSANVKTGNMVQTYILIDNGLSPVENARHLFDAGICGNCPHRRGLKGACYVNLGQGPRAVADGVVRGIYPADAAAARAACAGRMVRLGTYGDPAAVPAQVWQDLVSEALGTTGYSHQWNNDALPIAHRAAIGRLTMASADNAAQAATAKAQGLRYFRIRVEDEPLTRGEFVCPASEEAGKVKTCAECAACSGTKRTGQASPVIIVHGSLASRYRAQRAA